MGTESRHPAEMVRWLREKIPDASERIAREIRAGTPPMQLLAGLQAHAAALGEPGDLSALLAIDAVWDLLPLWAGEEERLLGAAAVFLRGGTTRPVHPEWLERAPLETGPVYGGSLDLVLEPESLEQAGSRVARMLAVIQTPEYFHELLLEAASRERRPPGWILSGVNAGVRALTGRSWSEGREIAFRLVEALHHSRRDLGGGLRRGTGAPLPIALCFDLAARDARDMPGACQYLAHAYQADRTCRLKQNALRSSIGAALDAWFAGLEGSPAGWSPAPLDDAAEPSGRAAFDLAEGGPELARRIAAGEGEGAGDLAIALLGNQRDPDPLFRWISEACLPALEAGDPLPLLMVNGSRWGAHLLGGSRGALLRRVIAELAR
jgi:hypothetical protein